MRFRCPAGLLFPLFAVQSKYGLNFPLCGVTVATAPEIASAVFLGIEVIIERGVVIPFRDDPVQPYAEFVREMIVLRSKLKAQQMLPDKDLASWESWVDYRDDHLASRSAGVRPRRPWSP